MNTVGDYHDPYLKRCFIISWYFLKFINTCLEYCGLDTCHYFSSPGWLSWDAMLKMTGKLELISDTVMHLFIEKGMRGGISYIAKRFDKTNNTYMKSYNDKKPSKCIMHWDTNNLYGWVMSQYLPYSGFKWLYQKEIDTFDVNTIGGNSSDR